MMFTPAAVGTDSTVLALSKMAWKLGISLSKLDQDTKIVDTTIKSLAEEVKSLGNECDLIYAELVDMARKGGAGSPSPYDVEGRLWGCLGTQVEETSLTMQELDLFVKSVRGEGSSFIGQAQRQRKVDRSKIQIASIKTRLCCHTKNLRIVQLLINTVLAHILPCRADRELARDLDKLQEMIEELRRSSKASSQSQTPHTDATLIQYVREVIVRGTVMYKACLATDSVIGGQGTTNGNIRVAEWMSTLDDIRRDQRDLHSSEIDSDIPSITSEDELYTIETSATSAQYVMQERETVDAVGDDSGDDLNTDLAKAALQTGTKAFEAQEWEEAGSLIQEALRLLQQLPKQQRVFCNVFGLHYKLAVCAYHTQEPTDAEEALMSLAQQSAGSDEQRGNLYDAVHLLSHLYIRMGQLDRARSECEKALQARRRLLGKHSDASLESTALMAHIYFLLNNNARAKSCLAMIPEDRKNGVLKTVSKSLGTKVEHLDSPSLLTRSISGDSDLEVDHIQSKLSAATLALPLQNHTYGPASTMTSQSPVASRRQSYQRIPSNQEDSHGSRSIAVTPRLAAKEMNKSEKEGVYGDYSQDTEALDVDTTHPGDFLEAKEIFSGKALSRKEILDKVGCQPRDRIEDAVCNGDYSTFASLLNKKKDFWRSKLRKRVRPERVTALHFAALFGEIDMARRLIGSNFSINEAPYGYTTSLTPLKFAIGARQVGMVEFLIENGAKPSKPDSWSTLAEQLMNRSWLMKTVSETEKEKVPSRIIAILRVLLKHGLDVNAPFETSGGTLLHQAVAFWTGSYRWDLSLRASLTSFLCEQGADPFRANGEGKTPYDMASASGHQELVLILDQGSRNKASDNEQAELFELCSEPIDKM